MSGIEYANAGPVALGDPPVPLRGQTVVDQDAARRSPPGPGNLVAGDKRRAVRSNAPMLTHKAPEVGNHAGSRFHRGVVRSSAAWRVPRLRGGRLVPDVRPHRRSGQIMGEDGNALDPARSGLKIALPVGGSADNGWSAVNDPAGAGFAVRRCGDRHA